MIIYNWEEWMAKHHIKLKGDSHDNKSDAVDPGGGISWSEVETEVHDDAGKTNSGHIQKYGRKRKTS